MIPRADDDLLFKFDTYDPDEKKFRDGKFCAHCANTGLVELDGRYDDGYAYGAAPCPACTLGAARSGIDFWAAWDPAVVTWQGGHTLRHYFCVHCKVWVKAPHAAPACSEGRLPEHVRAEQQVKRGFTRALPRSVSDVV